MKNIYLLLICFTLLAINTRAQKHINQIKIGDYFPENYKTGGWKVHRVDKGYSEFDCKAFVIDYSMSIESNSSSAVDFERNGGTLSERMYFFLNEEGRVIAKKELEIVMYAGSNGLRKFLSHKKRITNYIKNYPETWNSLDEHEFSNLERYFAYTVEKYTATKKQVVKVISIQDNKYFEETYLPDSNYSPLYIVGDPNEKFVAKSTMDILLSDGYLDEFCKDMKQSEDVCKCFNPKALKFLTDNKDTIEEHEIMGEVAKILYECGK